MTNNTNDVMELWNAFKPMIEKLIEEKTKSCIRAQRATVVTAPNSTTGKIGVQIPFDNKVLSLPFSSSVANVTENTQVWIITPHDNNLSNGVVVQNGSWTL